MKRIGWIFVLGILLAGCPQPKKQEPKKDDVKADSSTSDSDSKMRSGNEESTDYEATGSSTLKTESLARSKAELKARENIINTLSADAGRIVEKFSTVRKDLFAGGVDAAQYAKQITEAFKKSTTLRNSRISEYSKSDNGDTTFATIEMPLMNGYDEIERVVVEVGTRSKFLSSDVDGFKKNFKEFFLAEKKKQLTTPG